MKEQFAWYLAQRQSQLEEIWGRALLTLDACVLLDLFRVHSKTKEILIKAIESFEDRIWLTYQASYEFISNMNKVRYDSVAVFDKIYKDFIVMEKNITSYFDNVRGSRILDEEGVERFVVEFRKLFEELHVYVNKAKEKHLQEVESDTILDWVVNSFDGRVGSPIPDGERDALKIEAKSRIEKKIPPGFEDKSKGDEKAFGDIFLWKQILQKAKEKESPIILVTSEKKEDWWEIIRGKIVGQRPEMLQEAFDVAHQVIRVMRTGEFIKFYAEKQGKKDDTQIGDAIHEFEQLDEGRLAIVRDQLVENNTECSNGGKLVVELLRPARYFTGSGHLSPKMLAVPSIEATLQESPDDIPKYVIKAGTGTCYDFNIHIKTSCPTPLPSGRYVFEYHATCESHAPDVGEICLD